MSYPLCSRGGMKNKNPNPNHNIWNNNGTFWCHYTVHGNDYTKKRVRVSLGTNDVEIARALRDFVMQATSKVTDNIPRGQTVPADLMPSSSESTPPVGKVSINHKRLRHRHKSFSLLEQTRFQPGRRLQERDGR